MLQGIPCMRGLYIDSNGENGSLKVRRQSANPEPCAQNHEAWLKQVSEKMETIKPGMTRWDLLKVLRTEGTIFHDELGVRRLPVERRERHDSKAVSDRLFCDAGRTPQILVRG